MNEPAPVVRRQYSSPVAYGGRTIISLLLLLLAIIWFVVIGWGGDPFKIGFARQLAWALAFFAASFLPI